MVLMVSSVLMDVRGQEAGVLVQVMCVTHQEEKLSVKTHLHYAGTTVTGESTTSHATGIDMMDCCGLLVSDVLVTFNIAVGHGTDGMMLGLATTRPVLTNQTKCSPSTPAVVSSTNSSWRLTDHSGARVTRIGTKGNTVMVVVNGTLILGNIYKNMTN